MALYRGSRAEIPLRDKGLILCEGETEKNYFKGLINKKEYKLKFSSVDVDVYKPKDHSPKGLVIEAKKRVNQAKRDKSPYKFVWVVFDKDGHSGIPQAFHLAATAKPEIKIAFTVTCFEYFVLLHFKRTTKSFSKCDDVITELKMVMPDYEKASNLYVELEGRSAIGIANSEWCINQCRSDLESGLKPYQLSVYSNVHLLVKYLIDYK